MFIWIVFLNKLDTTTTDTTNAEYQYFRYKELLSEKILKFTFSDDIRQKLILLKQKFITYNK